MGASKRPKGATSKSMSQAGWQKRGKTTGGTQLGNTGALDVKTFLTQYGLEGFESAERHEASDSAQANRLLEKQKENHEMQDALDKKRRDIEARDRWCKEKEDELQRRKEEMRAREAKFNQFVKENEAKRNHAIKKRKEELEETKKKEAEIERHKQELDEFSRLRDQRRAHLDHMSKYSNFIDAVVEYGDRFHDVSELLSRYETLKQSNKDLRERIDKTNTELENTRSELYRYTKEKDNEFLFLTSQIAANQKQLDHIKSEIQEYEERWQAQREVENEEMRKAGRAKMAIDNLYKRARETTHLVKSKFEHQSLFEKLDYIETRMHDLKEIVHAARNNNLDALLPPGRR